MARRPASHRADAGLRAVLTGIARTAASLCEADNALILLVEGDRAAVVARHGRLPSRLKLGESYPLSADLVGNLAIRQRRTIHVRDLAGNADARFRETKAFQLPLGIRTVLVTPLLRGGATIGAIAIRRTRVQPFTRKQIALLKTFADQAAIAIENARLSEDLRARNRELSEALDRQTATADVLRIIAQSPTDLKPVLGAIASSAVRLCAASDVVIERLEGDRFYNAAHAGTQMKGLVGLPLPLTRRFPGGRAVLDRTPIILDDIHLVAESEYPDTLELLKLNTIHSVAEIPLLSEGKPLGSLAVLRADVRPFTDAEIALLKTFADQAVIAIENVRLFTELQDRNRALTEALEQQTATSEILRVISRSQSDVQPVFDAIAQSAVRLCDAVFSGVFRVDGGQVHLVAQTGIAPEALEVVRQTFPVPLAPAESAVARAIAERSVVHVVDTEAPEIPRRTREAGRAIGFRNQLSVPMLRGGEPIGGVNVSRREPGPFSETQIDLLKTFADQAVIAIENVRLFTELQARNRELTEALEQQTATEEILRVIGHSPTDAQPVFEAIARSAVTVCEALGCAVFIVEGGMLHVAATHGVRPERIERFRTEYPMPLSAEDDSAETIRTGRLFHLADIEHNPNANARQIEFARLAGYRTRLMVPMVRGNNVLGLIAVTREDPTPFPDRRVELLQTFADQAVIAIENVRLFKELQARNRDLTEALEQQTATAEILRAISGSPSDVQPVFDIIAERARQLCDAEISVVTRFDGELIHLAALHGITSEGTETVRRLYPHSVHFESASARAVRNGAIVHVPDVLADPQYEAKDAALAARYRSALAVPMLREGQVIGAIFVARADAGYFADSQVELLKTFADQAVIAVENVRLFTELRVRTGELTRSVEQLTALGEVGRAVSSTLELETVLTTIASRANQLAGTHICTVYEYDEGAEEFRLRATHNLPEEVAAIARARPVRKGEGAAGRMAETRQPVQIPDIALEGAYQGPLREALLQSGSRAVLTIPLLREDRLLGALTVTRRTPGAFGAEIVELLNTFAAQSAIAIHNARLFREIEAKGRELEVASRHKSQFLANMSHELRTPLNAILGYSELILDGIYGEVPTKMREVLDRVDKGGRHLLGLINDVLDLSKIEAGQLTLTLEEYALSDVILSVVGAVESLAGDKGLALTAEVPPDLPIGRGDQRRLIQVVMNLVGNAIKFTDRGRVTIGVVIEGETFHVAVADTGPGIAPDDQERIFHEFEQAETTVTRAKGGTGLGLAIARRIVELHGGRLWVASSLGEGSTFHFMVPIRVEHSADTRRATAP